MISAWSFAGNAQVHSLGFYGGGSIYLGNKTAAAQRYEGVRMQTIEGYLKGDETIRIAIVLSRFNDAIGNNLLAGARDALLRHGVADDNITLVKVPGAFEIPLAAKKLAVSKKYDGIICLGAVIRGATGHYELVAGQTASGIASASLQSGVPVAFGVLTTDTIEQAVERAGTKAGNKGSDAALATLEMIDLLKQF